MIEGIALVVAIAVVAGLAGLGLGMLLSRPLDRLADRSDAEDEDPGDGRA